MRKKNWFKPKPFTHFTQKLSHTDGKWIKEYVSNPDAIKSHPFYPLIHRTITAKRFKASEDKNGQPVKRHYTYKNGAKVSNAKYREVYYPNHLDAHIYSYYTQKILEPIYDTRLKGDPELNECVLAYRRIPITDNSRCKSNIDFAYELFQCIQQMDGSISVSALDITKFFDSLDHKRLKQAWAGLLGKKDLDNDHYNLYKNLTRFDYVEMKDLLSEFGYKNPRQLIQKDVAYFVRDGKGFQTRIKQKGYLKRNPFRRPNNDGTKTMVGIPQGTPISPFLANLYLYEFDKDVLKLVKKHGGIYRRYSDDIILICPKSVYVEIENEVCALIKKERLIIQPTKTQRSFFDNGKLEKGQKPLTYLGFQFDGNKIRIKSGSISKFFRKMKKAVKYRAFRALEAKKKTRRGKKIDATLHRKKLYTQFSFLGSGRRVGRKRNFFSYAYSAGRIMNSPDITKQLSKAWKILHHEIHRQEKKYRLPKIKKRL